MLLSHEMKKKCKNLQKNKKAIFRTYKQRVGGSNPSTPTLTIKELQQNVAPFLFAICTQTIIYRQ